MIALPLVKVVDQIVTVRIAPMLKIMKKEKWLLMPSLIEIPMPSNLRFFKRKASTPKDVIVKSQDA